MITLLGWALHIIRVNWFVFKLTVKLEKCRHCLILKINFPVYLTRFKSQDDGVTFPFMIHHRSIL